MFVICLPFYTSEPDWKSAAEYYEKYILIREKEANQVTENSGDNEEDNENSADMGVAFHDQHDIVARLATLYQTGGSNLSCNYQRAGRITDLWFANDWLNLGSNLFFRRFV